MKKNMVKILSIILIALLVCGISSSVFATGLVGKVNTEVESDTEKAVGSIGGMIVRILQVIGVAAAIIMLVFLGIKYVSAAPSEKADIKKSAAIYVVGAVMLLGATFILGLIEGFIEDLNKTTPSPSASITSEYIHLA